MYKSGISLFTFMQSKTSRALSPRQYFSLFAFLGFGISLVVHLLTFLGLNLSERAPWIWLLHVGMFVFFIPLVFSRFNRSSRNSRSDFWQRFFAPMPRWARALVKGLFVYVPINFLLFFALSYDGTPDINNGKYILRRGGRGETLVVVREISKEEYDLRQDRVVRGFSGHWMIFYIAPALYFWFPRNKKEDERS
jgi:hypothetical protein